MLSELWECAAPPRKAGPLQEPAALPEGIPARERGKGLMEAQQGAGRAARALPHPGSHPGQRSRPSDALQVPSAAAPSRKSPISRRSRYLRSPRSFLLSLWCRSHFHLPLLFSFSSTFTTSFSWPEGTPEPGIGGRAPGGLPGQALPKVGPPEGVQGSSESLQGWSLKRHWVGNWDHVPVGIFP